MESIMREKRMILIGASGRNLGKTQLTTGFIKKYSQKGYKVVGVKIITIHDSFVCPVHKGCSMCTSLCSEYEIKKQEIGQGKKDTEKYLISGAEEAYLVRAYPYALAKAIKELLNIIPSDTIIICESNSLRDVITPAKFLMIKDSKSEIKPSARNVWDKVDFFLESRNEKDIRRVLNKKLI